MVGGLGGTSSSTLFGAMFLDEEREVKIPSAREFFETFDSCYDVNFKMYRNIPFDSDVFKEQLTQQVTKFHHEFDHAKEHGFIEKKDVNKGAKVFVRADLHGDLRSLLENLRTLQKEGHLDENFKCKEDVHLVFLGDYCDRGDYGGQVLQLLAALRMENPGGVTLIRGNHENAYFQFSYNNGSEFTSFLFQETNLLDDFYDTMPLTAYIGVKGEKREYAQFTHGVFELYVDPQKMLSEDAPTATMNVSKERVLSERVKDMPQVKRITALMNSERYTGYTAYSWGDVGNLTVLGPLESRQWQISGKDIKEVFRACSADHKIKILFRGHEHEMKFINYMSKKGEEKTICITLTVGMDTEYYANYLPNQADAAYLLTTDNKVKDWEKTAYLRQPYSPNVRVTLPRPIRTKDF